MQIKKERWGTFKSREIYLYTLTNTLGGVVQLTNYGARIVAIRVEDKDGALGDVALGFDHLNGYLEDEHYIGATMGRFANRISHAQFELEGTTWKLEANEGLHCNHSASAGFDHRVFEMSDAIAQDDLRASGKVAFHLRDPHGRGGFPGDLELTITYSWEEQSNRLSITYEATSNRSGILNLTNHCYFNLSSRGAYQDCLSHRLTIESDSRLETDAQYIPTGRHLPVENGQANELIRDLCRPMGRKITTPAGTFKGLNTCFELPAASEQMTDPICRLRCDGSGRELVIATSYPGLLVYTGDDLHSYGPGYFGRPYQAFDGVALECQYYPDTPNLPGFPPALIGPDKPYHEFITYTFTTDRSNHPT